MQNLTNGMELDSIILIQPFTIKTFVVSKGEATFLIRWVVVHGRS